MAQPGGDPLPAPTPRLLWPAEPGFPALRVRKPGIMGLLMDGEVSIQQEGNDQPFVYRGFQMVSEEKLNELRGDQLRKMVQSGMLPLLYAHLFSLSLMREIFARQVKQGKQPQPQLVN